MEKEIKDLNEKFEEETRELIEESAIIGLKLFNKTTKRIFTRGFVIGALAAISVQSIITILVLMGN